MHRTRLLLLPLLTLTLALGAAGCQSLFGGDDPADTSADTYDDLFYADTNLSLEAEDGGYDRSDEQPNFGDPSFIEMFPEGDPANDAVGDDVGLIAMESDPNSQVYYLRMVWGQLRGNHEITENTNWGGSIQVDRGAIIVLRRIRFEDVTDWVVFPRSDMTLVELYTWTRNHNDGLLLRIVDPEPDSDEPNNLVIDMGPAQFTVPVAELDGYAEVLDVDELGNQMSLKSPELLECPNGFMQGVWTNGVRGRARGVLRGAYLSYEGELLGHMRGHWGVDDAGEQVFYAKLIRRDGTFWANARGTWTGDEDGPFGRGAFNGTWYDVNGELEGLLGGHYRRGFRRGGFYDGRWVEHCD